MKWYVAALFDVDYISEHYRRVTPASAAANNKLYPAIQLTFPWWKEPRPFAEDPPASTKPRGARNCELVVCRDGFL